MSSKSPFPGMDPYLEEHWNSVHPRLIVYMGDQIAARLPEGLQARVEESLAVDASSYRRTIRPDVVAVEALKIREPASDEPGGVAVAEPLTIALPSEAPKHRSIKIVERDGNQVITAIELLSPANKLTDRGRAAYLLKQREYLEGDVNLVEIDLIRRGESVLAVPPELIPVQHCTPYAACVSRVSDPLHVEYYPIRLQLPLPNIRIPLRRSDADIVLELQTLLGECYRRGRYDSIDYSQPLGLEFSRDDQAWIDRLLRDRSSSDVPSAAAADV